MERLEVIPAGVGGTIPPKITIPPADLTVTAPEVATFRVGASGDPPLAYQWMRNGKSVVGATVASYTLELTKVEDNGATFAVVVSNEEGSVTSPTATLTVKAPPSSPTIVTPPVDVTVNSRDPATFRVTVTGTPAPTHQWRRDGIPIPGATKAA